MTPEQVRITPLEWSDERGPCEDCRYNHVVADSGLGLIRIEWKGWKEFDSRTVYVAGEQVGDADTLKGAKLRAENHIRQVVTSLIESPLAMQAQQVAVPANKRGPLSDDEIAEWFVSENGLEDSKMCIYLDFEAVIRAVEARLGITPQGDKT